MSELRKRTADPRVANWIAEVPPEDRYLSVLVVGEIRRGIERLRPRDRTQATVLDAWLGTLLGEYTTRILPINLEIAERWGHISSAAPLSTADALLAATALEHDLTVATRNTRDLIPTGVATVNPWEHGE